MLELPLTVVKALASRSMRVAAGRVSTMFSGDLLRPGPEVRLPRVDRLYELAKRDQWNYTDLRAKDERGIDDSLLLPAEREAVARVVSQLYYGERGALLISSQLAAMVPDSESSAFLTSQSFDEARHMEVFSGMARDLHELAPINPCLQVLLSDLLQTRHLADKLLGMNLLVEGLALSVFHHMLLVFSRHPRIQGAFGREVIVEPIENIVRDESRHVGFGVLYLPELVKGLSFRRKAELMARQLGWMALMYGSVKLHEKDSALLGLSFTSVLTKVLEDHQRRAEEMGLSVVLGGRGVHHLLPVLDSLVNTVFRQHIEVADIDPGREAA